jgi:hypothetical protein
MLQRKCACGDAPGPTGECEECRQKKLQRKAQNSRLGTRNNFPVPPIVHDVLRAPGQPLDAPTRAFMEPRFGHDFSSVRVHTNSQAAESAQAVDALAYTVGNNIVFAPGQHAPNSQRGANLLAHELTHVVQQQGETYQSGSLLKIDPAPRLEEEATAFPTNHLPRSLGTLGLQRTPAGASGLLRSIDPATLPASWRATPLPLSGGQDVYLYRGFARNVETHVGNVVREGEIGGILSRNMDAAQDAIFNQIGRDPVLSGAQRAGVVKIRVPGATWDELVKSNSISERGNYPGFSRKIVSTEIRVNSVEAGRLINDLPKEIVAPDPHFDFRPGAVRPSAPRAPAEGGESGRSPERASTGAVEGVVEDETTAPIRAPSAPSTTPNVAPSEPVAPAAVPDVAVAPPKVGLGTALKSGFSEGLEAAFSPEGIASMVPMVVLAIADKVAASEAIKQIQIKFLKEGFAKGVAAGIMSWSADDVRLNLLNRVTEFRVKGMEDPGGILTTSYIFQLAQACENYAVNVGFAFSAAKSSGWKKNLMSEGFKKLGNYGYHWKDQDALFEYDFIDKLAFVIRDITNPMVERAIVFH